MADEEVVERKDAVERRVYNLPTALVLKLRAFQAAQNIPSETEAARRLIEAALQARETVFDILLSVEVMVSNDPSLRNLGAELMKHSLITGTMLIDGGLVFSMTDGHSGRVSPDRQGSFNLNYTDQDWRHDNWSSFDQWKRENRSRPKHGYGSTSSAGWEPSGNDLDDEIPF